MSYFDAVIIWNIKKFKNLKKRKKRNFKKLENLKT